MTEKCIRKVVIPIAGHGTRMFPCTKVIPKALFPMIDPTDGMCKPVLQIVIEEALSALGDEALICIVLSPNQRPLIESHFKVPDTLDPDDKDIGAYVKKEDCKKQLERIQYISKKLTLVEQKEQKGFGHAVLCAKDFVGHEPFLVMLGDHVYTSTHPLQYSCTKQLISTFEIHRANGDFASATTLSTCPTNELHLNGVIAGKLIPSNSIMKCMDLDLCIEKPSYEQAKDHGLILSSEMVMQLSPNETQGERSLCFFGIDLMSPKLFDILEQNQKENKLTKGELQLRDGQRELMKKENGKMLGVFIQGQRHDTGIPTEYTDTMLKMSSEFHKKK